MDYRSQLPRILNDMGLMGIGVEVGVYEGRFSETLLKLWKGKKLYLIDSWRYMHGIIDILSNRDNNKCLNAMAQTFMKVYDYGTKACMIRELSVDASRLFSDGSLDFCYIDASHDKPNVTMDLEAWYPKVKSGGIVAGHDYVDGMYEWPDGFVKFEVKTAVDEFFKDKNVKIGFTKEEITETFISWYTIKP